MAWQEALQQALPPGAVVRQSDELHLDPQPRNVGVARTYVAAQAPRLPDEDLHVLLLLTSELVTNAVVHARTEIELAVTVTDQDVVVTVHDLDLGRLEQRAHERDGGRGLGLVRDLAADSGQTVHGGGGKTSWFRLQLPDQVKEAHS